jgi:hypothetical protein
MAVSVDKRAEIADEREYPVVKPDVELASLQAVARGSECAVYLHPDHPELVFKVVVGKDLSHMRRSFERMSLRLFPNKLKMRRTRKEMDSYLLAKMTHHEPGFGFPAAEMRGFYETDLGLAIAFERVADKDGELGPSLENICRERALTAWHLDLLNDFVIRLLTWNPVASDLNLTNIVLGLRNDVEQFILVDGMGAPHLIPLRYWSRAFNRREMLGKLGGMGAKLSSGADGINVRFDRVSRRFEMTEAATSEVTGS